MKTENFFVKSLRIYGRAFQIAFSNRGMGIELTTLVILILGCRLIGVMMHQAEHPNYIVSLLPDWLTIPEPICFLLILPLLHLNLATLWFYKYRTLNRRGFFEILHIDEVNKRAEIKRLKNELTEIIEKRKSQFNVTTTLDSPEARLPFAVPKKISDWWHIEMFKAIREFQKEANFSELKSFVAADAATEADPLEAKFRLLEAQDDSLPSDDEIDGVSKKVL